MTNFLYIKNGNSKGKHLIICIIFLFLFLVTSKSYCKPPEEMYITLFSGTKANIDKIDSVGTDTLYYTFENNKSTVPIDSIAGYYHYAPGKGGKGFLIGAVSGLLLGGLIGVIAGPTETITYPIDETENALIYGTAGALCGGLVGLLVGNGSKINTTIDYKNFNKSEKQKSLYNIYLYNNK